MPSARRPLVIELVRKARRARPGRCLLCNCTDASGCFEGCWWIPRTGNRLCSAHPHDDLVDAKRALRRADKDVRHV